MADFNLSEKCFWQFTAHKVLISKTLPWYVTLAIAGLEWGLHWIISMESSKKLLMKDGYEHRDL